MSKHTKICPDCGKAIPGDAEVCPECSAVIPVPLVKRWWFWVLTVLVIGAAAAGAIRAGILPEFDWGSIHDVIVVEPVPETDAWTAPSETVDSGWTDGQREAYEKAREYVEYSCFARSELIDLLVDWEDVSREDAAFAVEALDLDWREQALGKALEHLEFGGISEAGMKAMLELNGFSEEEVGYAVENCGADWFEQAVRCAESYLEFMEPDAEELYDQLLFEEFTEEQARAAVETLELE